jgi:hypothetical protein
MIAAAAGADEILPAMTTSPMSGDDVVKRQVMRLLPAILAGKCIPPEDFTAG